MSARKLPSPILQKLRCQCGQYFSNAPICLKNGHNLCSDCAVDQGGTIRNTPYEVIASIHRFPCKYEPEGCLKFIRFDKLKDHEMECMYRLYECPVKLHSSCNWKGFLSQFSEHYEQQHPDLYLEVPFFTISVNENYEVYRLCKTELITVLLHIKCDVERAKLWFNAVNLAPNDMKYTILLNSSDSKRMMTLKGSKLLLLSSVNMVAETWVNLNIPTVMDFLGEMELITCTWIIDDLEKSENQVDEGNAKKGQKRKINDNKSN